MSSFEISGRYPVLDNRFCVNTYFILWYDCLLYTLFIYNSQMFDSQFFTSSWHWLCYLSLDLVGLFSNIIFVRLIIPLKYRCLTCICLFHCGFLDYNLPSPVRVISHEVADFAFHFDINPYILFSSPKGFSLCERGLFYFYIFHILCFWCKGSHASFISCISPVWGLFHLKSLGCVPLCSFRWFLTCEHRYLWKCTILTVWSYDPFIYIYMFSGLFYIL